MVVSKLSSQTETIYITNAVFELLDCLGFILKITVGKVKTTDFHLISVTLFHR